MARHRWFAAAALTALAGPALLMAQARSGYLPAGTIDIVQILPPAPKEGDPRYAADRAIFQATRHWQGTPRWAMATRDVATKPAAMAEAFSCSLGVTLNADTAPRTLALIAKAGVDTGTQSGTAKNVFRRLRPFQIDSGATCQAPEELKGSFDYPSGHTTWGWTWGMLLAEVAPDRATPILARARAYGESRIVCGVHNATAVEGGRITASATLAAVNAQAAFQADLAAARAEIARLRADPAAARPKDCDAESRLVAQPIL